MYRHLTIASAVLALAAGVAWAAADWSAARDKAREYQSGAPQLKRTAVTAAREIVREICSASDDDRKSAASSAASSASSSVSSGYSDLARIERDAEELLSRVVDEDAEHRDEARELSREIHHDWEKLDEHTRGLRDGHPAVVELMLDGGERARRDRGDRCTARHVAVGGGHADCIQVRGDTCSIIALTSDSSRAVSAGRDHAQRITRTLEQELKTPNSDVIKRLIDSNSDFARCKHFEAQVDCYHLCPDIDEDARPERASPSWRDNC